MASSFSIPLIHLGAIALFALLSGLLFARLRLPAILAYVLAGVVLGPLGFSFLIPLGGLWQLAFQFGLLGLLFYLGLELDAGRLSQSGNALALSAVGAALGFSFGFAAARLLGFSVLDAALAGGLIAVSSTVAALAQPLASSGFGSLLRAFSSFEDLLGVLLWLAVAGAAVATGFTLAYAVLVFLALLVAVRYAAKRLDPWLEKRRAPEGMLAFSLAAGLLGAAVMDALVFLPLAGAYLAGTALSASIAGGRIRREMPLLRDGLVLFFFVAAGAAAVFDGLSLALAGALFAAYLLARAFSFSGFFARLVGPDAGLALGLCTLALGEFSLLIGFFAWQFSPAGPTLLSAAVVLVGLSGLLSALSSRFAGLPRTVVRAAASGPAAARIWSATKHAAVFAAIAVGVCLLASLLPLAKFPALFGLEPRMVAGLLILPFVVWPVYQSLSSLRLAVSIGVVHAFGPAAALSAGEAVVGALALVGGLLSFSWLYGSGLPEPFIVLSAVYVGLSFVFLSHLLWRRPAYTDSGVVAGLPDDFRGAAQLNAERLLSQQRIAKALARGDKPAARKILSDFRKKEASVLEKSGRRTDAHPFRHRAKKTRHLEGYFFSKRREPGRVFPSRR